MWGRGGARASRGKVGTGFPRKRRGRAVLALLALALASCGPPPAVQADICAIFALPGVPGDTRLGDARALAWGAARERQLLATGLVYAPPWRLTGDTRSWGRCPARAAPVQMLLISPDRAYAMTKGGRFADGRPSSFGTCFYERRETGWRLRACRINPGF